MPEANEATKLSEVVSELSEVFSELDRAASNCAPDESELTNQRLYTAVMQRGAQVLPVNVV